MGRHRSGAARAEAPLRQVATPRNWLRGRLRIASGRAQPEPKHRFGRRRRPATGCGAGVSNNQRCRTKKFRLARRRTVPHARSASRKPISPKNLFRARGDHHPNLPFVVHARQHDRLASAAHCASENDVPRNRRCQIVKRATVPHHLGHDILVSCPAIHSNAPAEEGSVVSGLPERRPSALFRILMRLGSASSSIVSPMSS